MREYRLVAYYDFVKWVRVAQPDSCIGRSNCNNCPLAEYLRSQGFLSVRVQPNLFVASNQDGEILFQYPDAWSQKFMAAIDRIFDWTDTLQPRNITASSAMIALMWASTNAHGTCYPAIFDPSIPPPPNLPDRIPQWKQPPGY